MIILGVLRLVLTLAGVGGSVGADGGRQQHQRPVQVPRPALAS